METLLGRRVAPNQGSASPHIGRWIDRGSRSLLLLFAGLLAAACEQAPTLPTPEPEEARFDVASTQTVGVPELPRVFLNTRSVAPTGKTIRVPSGGNLQNAINSAVPGDQIVLQAGATYTGNFSLPAKSGSGWIVIRSSATLPTEGTRITPAQAGLLPKLVSPNSGKTVYTKSGAHHYRLVGLEITHASGVTGANTPVDFGSGSSNMILDRSYVHGNSRLDLRRCVVLNSARSAVIDSYLSRCHSRSYDSQAIISWNSPGPLKIVNNYLEGAGENIMFGGATPSTNVLPSDIEIRGNHFFKPLEWRTSGTWLVKNLLEVKFGQRILLEGNVFENNWSDGQDGSALNIKRSASSTCTWCVTQDITLRNNVVRGSTNGIRVASTKRFLIENNLFHKLSGKMFILLGGLENLTVRHNTGFAPSYIAMADGSAQKGFVFRDNLMSRGNYGIKGSGKGEGYYTFNYYMPGYSVAGNVLIGAPASRYPAGNFFPAEKTDVGFVSLSGEDYRLGSGSRYSDKATDGTDPGADFSALLDATDGVVR